MNGNNKRTKAPPMADFVNAIKYESISKQNRYYAELGIPPIMFGDMNPSELELICLYVEQAMFPEFALATQASRATSLQVELPYDKMFGNVSMTFICDRDMKIKSFFDSWAMGVMDNTGGVFKYYDDYVIPELNIYQYDEMSDVVYCVSLYNAYPKIVNDMILSSSSKDYNRFQVVFAYEQWKSWDVSNFRNAASMFGPPSGLDENGLESRNSAGGLANALLGGGASTFTGNFNSIPGIDSLGVTGMSSALGVLGKANNPQLMKDSLKRSGKSVVYEAMKPMKQQVLEQLPASVRQIGGSALQFGSSKLGM